jgi:hypothetical protein
MSRSDPKKTSQRRQWTTGSSAGRGSGEQDPEHRAQAWAALGAALLGLGTAGGGTLATIGAVSHLWGDDAFLAGFALSCLLAALGLYGLLAGIFGSPLPPTRLERAGRRKPAQSEPLSPAEASRSARRPPHPGSPIAQVPGPGLDAAKQHHKLVLRHADELLRNIFEAERLVKATPAGENEILYYNLAARVEAWARGIGCFDEVQKFSGNVAADLPRLKVFVQTQLERWRDEQERPVAS